MTTLHKWHSIEFTQFYCFSGEHQEYDCNIKTGYWSTHCLHKLYTGLEFKLLLGLEICWKTTCTRWKRVRDHNGCDEWWHTRDTGKKFIPSDVTDSVTRSHFPLGGLKMISLSLNSIRFHKNWVSKIRSTTNWKIMEKSKWLKSMHDMHDFRYGFMIS